ncbi:iron-dependent repressor IdeR [bacterium BMS3Abin05]|nr:iron-dependent repressor IdeR [bacterium BMS3Abin05]GBE27865.1 iron-dependent repressor IdeR [bacterium BMS3Bbin03]HDL78036.1 DtxR family transcriptional regulator [Bacteroidota bacterium]HDZ12731.1 DtxR family transcriptional regulator [Bacteroidota bacterium]
MDALTHSAENYLRAIFEIALENKVVRIRDIAKRMQVKMPSVVAAIQALDKKGYLVHEKYGYLELTEEGMEAARAVYNRHRLIFKFLFDFLKGNSQTAMEEACNLEHSLSDKTLQKLTRLMDYVTAMGQSNPEQFTEFQSFLEGKSGNRAGIRTVKTNNEAILLKELSIGYSAKVVRILGNSSLKRRLLDMGLVPGTLVTVSMIAPLGDPIDIIVKGYHLSLRREEASQILVIPTETEQ